MKYITKREIIKEAVATWNEFTTPYEKLMGNKGKIQFILAYIEEMKLEGWTIIE